jgi:hypothetical protein
MKVRLSQRMAATASGRLLVLVTVAVFIGFLGSTWLSQRRDDPRARRAIERG